VAVGTPPARTAARHRRPDRRARGAPCGHCGAEGRAPGSAL